MQKFDNLKVKSNYQWKKTYREYLKSKEWKEKSESAKERANYRCQICNSNSNLETHHRTYERVGSELPEDLTVLCKECHQLYETAKKIKKPQSQVEEHDKEHVRKREYTSSVCVLCGKSISVVYKLCKFCYKQYHMYMKEPWFLELARMEEIQNKINDMEPYSITDAVIKDIDEPTAQVAKNPIGRPATDWRVIRDILKIYDQDLDTIKTNNLTRNPISYRSIAKLVGNKVSYITVRDYIMTYRKKDPC